MGAYASGAAVLRMSFQLSKDQRRRLLAEDYRPLIFEIKPHGCDPGVRYVLCWSKSSLVYDEEGGSFQTPREPLWWIAVKTVKRQPDRLWLVRYDVVDRRDPDRFLRGTPPVYAAEEKNPSGDGSQESSYQSTRWRSPDTVPVVRQDWHETYHKRMGVSERDHLLRLKRVAAARADRRRRRYLRKKAA